MSSSAQISLVKIAYRGEVYARQYVAAGEVYKTPSQWFGRTVRFYSVGGSGRVIAGASPEFSINVDSFSQYNSSTFALLPSDQTAPLNLKDWSYTDFYFSSSTDLYFCVVGAEDGVGYWYAHVSDYQTP